MTDRRDFTSDKSDVRNTYNLQHSTMTVDVVNKIQAKWAVSKRPMTIRGALELLETFVDESDPDVDVENVYHAFQTAESIRRSNPDLDWFPLVGLIHDLGKVMSVWGEPQWLVVGDTFPVGCQFDESIVFSESFSDNPDAHDERYNTKFGMYDEHCGLDSLTMSWGHDEYMYRVLRRNDATIPDEGMNMIRYHSFYPWHTSNAYRHLTNDYDETVTKRWVNEFNKHDLYSKADNIIDKQKMEELWKEIYEPLCIKYSIDGTLMW